MTHHSNFLVATVLTLALTGALPRSHGAAAASGVCGLVTRQEAAAALGAPLPAGAEKTMDSPLQGGTMIKMQSCFYGSGVVVARYELGSGAQTLFGKYRQEFASQPVASDYQNVTGIGDEAFSAKGQLMIRKGQTGLLVGLSAGDRQNKRVAARQLEAEKTLAALALGRL